ncbi:MAG: MMPL family transporter [Thermoleophilaceae bacterium]
MGRLAGFLKRHPRAVLAAWVVLVAAATPFALRQNENLTNGGFSIPGSGSQAVNESIEDFLGAQAEQLGLLLARRPGSSAADVRAEIDRADRLAAELPRVELTDAAAAEAKRGAAERPITIAQFTFTGTMDQAADTAIDLRDELEIGEGPRPTGVEPYLVGQQALWAGMQDLSKEDLEKAEATGFPVVLLILLAVFGSLAAAALPVALGFASVVVAGAAIFFLSRATDMSVFVTNVASMIGIGVAVDYSLFLLARYREEVRGGAEPEAAHATAVRMSGLAVVFSGLTVVVSLAGLFLIDSTAIRSMAMGAVIVVAVSTVAAVTLLPVLMWLLGPRAYVRGRLAIVVQLATRAMGSAARLFGSRNPDQRLRPAFWEGWATRITRRPVVAAVLSSAAMLALAIPALSLEVADGALRQFPEGNETRVGAELAAKQGGGEGGAGPVQIVVEFDRGSANDRDNRQAITRYLGVLDEDRAIARVNRPVVSEDGRSVLFVAAPRHDPESAEARALVGRLRARGSDAVFGRAVDVVVGGATASAEDFKGLVSGSMWKLALFVLLSSYVVLLLLLRSALLPLKAVVMNLLSVGAAYGVLVMVFQYGWVDGLLGFESLGYITTMTPPLLLAVVFGLSMDYEVFLLSRIRERFDATGDTSASVAEGLRRSAATISSAALIMVAVFAIFAGTGVPSVKELGVGLAVAIALDATLIRLVLVPASMELMGRWNWWLPHKLGRIPWGRANLPTPDSLAEEAAHVQRSALRSENEARD